MLGVSVNNVTFFITHIRKQVRLKPNGDSCRRTSHACIRNIRTVYGNNFAFGGFAFLLPFAHNGIKAFESIGSQERLKSFAIACGKSCDNLLVGDSGTFEESLLVE